MTSAEDLNCIRLGVIQRHSRLSLAQRLPVSDEDRMELGATLILMGHAPRDAVDMVTSGNANAEAILQMMARLREEGRL